MLQLLNNNFVYRSNKVEFLTDRIPFLFHEIFQNVSLGSSTTQTRTDAPCETHLLKRTSSSKSCWLLLVQLWKDLPHLHKFLHVFCFLCVLSILCKNSFLWRGLLPAKSTEGELIKLKSQTEILNGQLPLNKGIHVMHTWNRCSVCTSGFVLRVSSSACCQLWIPGRLKNKRSSQTLCSWSICMWLWHHYYALLALVMSN